MKLGDILGLYDEDERIKREWPPLQRDASSSVVRHLPTGELSRDNGFIAYSRLDSTTADRAIEEQIDFFSGQDD
jgi:hypothetical protein